MTKKNHLQIIIALVAAVVLTAAFFILNRPEASASSQTTDDAYVRADLTVIAPQVSGVITTVLVDDNQHVEKGAPLFHIDDRELIVEVNNAQAAVDSLQAQLDRQQSVIAQARSVVAASSASLKLAERNHQRFADLARNGSGTVQAQQQAEAERAVQRAAYERDQAGLRSAEQQVTILRAELEKARAQKANADLKLSYASVTAPVAGIVAQSHVRVGGYAQTGESLLTLVPLDKVYIEANFRETQLARVQIGQSVDITVDALPGVRLKGNVESVGPASGASFSLVPAHNATGNFTKIVQRLPVRIQLQNGQKDAQKLRVGMSVTPTVRVKSAESTST
ncbi:MULTISPECIES: HlyD family secretion protein [unclassified Brenneria]|uniref:HlyD family secretion protein n=1 Tax=unclassified Brenneria TaxID=2634434 RepID=UPI0018F0F8F0|nr:HlyD family secretion protein [Brenneria sp. L3-3C-1]MBJ7221020.1 HlyD family secretion protein [Brenneria sp. L3-3C-1]MEE3642261.1 HlyD family secretion protein [Brenneria sp. L3_3C_1]